MPRCFACIHCGKCGDLGAEQTKLVPRGYCIFCKVQNDEDAQKCSSCGRPLPKPAGSIQDR